MNKKMEELQELGCDMEDVMARFLDDEDFYLQCFHSVLHDTKFQELKELINQGDVSGAFECAHTLKGLIANIGLHSLSQPMVEIVETLRDGSVENLGEKCDFLLQEREKYLKIDKES